MANKCLRTWTHTEARAGVLCAYCACATLKTTADHVFPRTWYPTSTPENVQRWTVPSCCDCNRGKGVLEEYCRAYLSAAVDVESEAAKGIWETSLRSMQFQAAWNESDRLRRHRQFVHFMAKTKPRDELRGRKISSAPHRGQLGLDVDWSKVAQLMELFARGSHYYIEKWPMPAVAKVKSYPHTGGARISAVVGDILASSTLYKLGPGITVRRANCREGTTDGAMYAFEFWGLPPFCVFSLFQREGPTLRERC